MAARLGRSGLVEALGRTRGTLDLEWSLAREARGGGGRALRAHDAAGRCLCPITAVVLHTKGVMIPRSEAREAADRLLDMDAGEACAVVEAADERPGHDRALRAGLLKAVGLEERCGAAEPERRMGR